MCRYLCHKAVTLNFFQGLTCSTPGAKIDKWTLKKVQGDGVVE